ncbi:MAG: rRNA maturation RNase YbeY [Pseudoprimorskyibacter sp.]|nr:rRNA maturation RNase YbeY [Pseudoprimorskyibacter sp.]
MDVDVVIEDARWQQHELERLCQNAVAATMDHLGLAQAELCVMGCDDTRIAELNAEFRGKPRATNVLSWPSQVRTARQAGDTPRLPVDPELGDIAISYETCRAEADGANVPFSDHVTHLIVHGMLHLLGYDHENDPDASLMERIETETLGKLGISDPYSNERRMAAPDID